MGKKSSTEPKNHDLGKQPKPQAKLGLHQESETKTPEQRHLLPPTRKAARPQFSFGIAREWKNLIKFFDK